MIPGLFGRRRKKINDRIVLDVYEALTTAARHPVLYERMGVPDTVMGRFDSISAHVIVFLRRAGRGSEAVRAVGQDIVDAFFLEVDHSIRELGIGDVSVPKNMKKFARMFYGRAESYGKALDAGDRRALGDALRRNLYPSPSEAAPDCEALAAYLAKVGESLVHLSDEDILNGRIALAAAAAPGQPEEPA